MHLKRIYVLRISLFISTMLILISCLPDLYIISMISPIYLKFTPQFRKVLWFDFGFAFDGTCLVQFLTILCFPITLLFRNSLAFHILCFGPFFVRNQNFASGVCTLGLSDWDRFIVVVGRRCFGGCWVCWATTRWTNLYGDLDVSNAGSDGTLDGNGNIASGSLPVGELPGLVRSQHGSQFRFVH